LLWTDYALITSNEVKEMVNAQVCDFSEMSRLTRVSTSCFCATGQDARYSDLPFIDFIQDFQ